MIQLKESLRILPVGALLVGLTSYSYQVRQLLVCWLFFTVLFVCMILVILIGELGVYAGECVAVRARSATVMPPSLEFAAIELPAKNISEPGGGATTGRASKGRPLPNFGQASDSVRRRARQAFINSGIRLRALFTRSRET